jgi:OmpA-OmpF porin, OOP family
MKSLIKLCVTFGVLLVATNILSAQEDRKNCKDHPLLSRMPNFYISSCRESDYDSHVFYDDMRNKYAIEGRKCMIYYKIKEGFKPAGVVNIRKNYVNAIKKIGGTVLKEGGYTYMKVVKDGKETWIELKLSTTTTGDNYTLTIVEKTVMDQAVVADPEAMAKDISSTGHVAVYGIYFDHDSYNIKTESDVSLNAIAEMLKSNRSLNVFIVGHTDMTGAFEYNIELSHNRAKAVADTLTDKYGIAANRLEAKGVGPLCPVSTNRTEKGRRLNRRVELVEKGGSGTGTWESE